MPNKHAVPMENVPAPFIKCGKSGVICMDHLGFEWFCERLYGDKNPDLYDALRRYIERTCRKFQVEVEVREIIGHMCEMALQKATAKGGWHVDNHIAYLMTVAKNKINKSWEYFKTHNHKEIDICEEFLFTGDVFKGFEIREIVQKSIKILEKRHPNDLCFILAFQEGYYENDVLSRHLGLENDAKFRKAKQRAKDRMREVVLDVMGRGPYSFRMLSKNNSYHTDILMKNNLTLNMKYVTRNIQFKENNEKSSKLINFIFNGISMPDIQLTMKRISFRMNVLWLKGAA
ncbi:MAG: sigma-70 family RNA polymerase sigma factor [Chitinophagia bacterium]|nr:sigma-70 family RNA polymerase sigma factor [Chitinophagia bacterium]